MGVDTGATDPRGSGPSGSSGPGSLVTRIPTSSLSGSLFDAIYFPVVGGQLPNSSHIGLPRSGGRSHQGLDLFATRGTTVVASVSGTVIGAGNVGGLGGVIVKIRDAHGNVHYYAHLDPSSVGLVSAGQHIQAGQHIGYVGDTGNAQGTSPHLHYSINEAGGGNGTLYDPWQFLSSGTLQSGQPAGGMSGNAAAQPGGEALNVPEGGTWYRMDNGEYRVAFEFWGTADRSGPNQVVWYRSAQAPPSGTPIQGQSAWNVWGSWTKTQGLWVDGGTTDAFRGATPGQTYQQMVDQVLMNLGLAGTGALQDPGVMAIVALAMTRELSPEELSNRLRQTAWFQGKSNAEREWDDLSAAEKEDRTIDEAMKLSGLWFTYVGSDLSVFEYDQNGDGLVSQAELQAGNTELYTWAQRIASGQATQAQAVNSWLKEEAKRNPNSPWSRTVRDEEKAQGQHGVDIGNTAGALRDLYFQWGVPLTDQKAKDLAEQVVMNKIALEDVENDLRVQAKALYPNKPDGLTTMQWAEPYMQTYQSTLEVNEPLISDALLQRGLRDNMTMTDFSKMLRADDRWLETNNAKAEMNETISSMGRVMGF